MKVFNYMLFMAAIMIVFTLAGVPIGFESLLSDLGINGGAFGFSTSSFAIGIGIAIATGAIVSSIRIGSFSVSRTESTIIAIFVAASLITFIGFFTSIINYANQFDDWLRNIFLIILAPLAVGYAIALLEFYRGTD